MAYSLDFKDIRHKNREIFLKSPYFSTKILIIFFFPSNDMLNLLIYLSYIQEVASFLHKRLIFQRNLG
jgi:hypothetical protein